MLTTYPATSGVACQILLGDARLSVVVHDNHPRSVKQGDERAADLAAVFFSWRSRFGSVVRAQGRGTQQHHN